VIDRYDAPEGMVAVRGYDTPEGYVETSGCDVCKGCYYDTAGIGCPKRLDEKADLQCIVENRKDKTGVIFVTRADFEKMLLQEIEQFYGKGKVKRIIFTKDNIK